ncbi:tetratricopeptide repeat-containing sensor histidine kinase [Christiangramia sp. SM2212]|uniref:histidine kinase n=1 Tax=Christiangramia sediminicola TaxID=3073267 RepID=A0ABU1ERS6_9FLAO|nr:tetratricopeptide repeat protein [Christiangramia sp. SM2212]MDR5591097.1 tetratricopeptide repeat protein [Christiangramia sp. SM2212]
MRKLSDSTLNKIARKNILDSAFRKTDTLQNDSLKNELLLEISYQYLILGDSISFLNANQEARDFSNQIKDSIGLAASQWDLAHFYHNVNTEDSAYYYYNSAQKIYQDLGDEYNSASLLLNMAIIQKNIKDYTGSEVSTTNAITLLKPLQEYSQLYAAYNNLGIIFGELEQYDKALEYFNIGISYLEKSGEENLYPSVWNNMGVVYRDSKRYRDALNYFEKALHFNSNIKNTDPELYAMILDNRAHTKLRLKDTIGIYEDFSQALVIRKNLGLESGVSINQLHLAEFFLEKGDTQKAKEYASKTMKLAKEIQNSRDLLSSLKLLSQIDPERSLVYANEYIALNDNLQKREREVRNKFARIRFETDEYISETERLNQRVFRISLISLGVLLVFVLLYIIKDQKSKNKFIKQKQSANQEIYNLILAQQKNFEEGKEKEKQHISRELHDGILGRLFGVRLSLDSLNEEDHKDVKKKRYEYIEEIQNIAEEIRLISHRLNKSSIIEVDFKIVLEELIRKQLQTVQLRMDSSINWEVVENDIKINFYRIIQEAINNIHKHAKATEAKVEISKEGNQLVLEVWDNGLGFNADQLKKGIGLENMKTRSQNIKGFFTIESGEEGTLIKVSVNMEKR